MTDVDAVRLLASEHNLEFVDLDRYHIDPSVAAVLPRKVATSYHVVPIGRKFGAPVIAIGDPSDVVAIDTLRAAVGRDFISVVAVSDQIDACIAKVYAGADSPPAQPLEPAGPTGPSTASSVPAPPLSPFGAPTDVGLRAASTTADGSPPVCPPAVVGPAESAEGAHQVPDPVTVALFEALSHGTERRSPPTPPPQLPPPPPSGTVVPSPGLLPPGLVPPPPPVRAAVPPPPTARTDDVSVGADGDPHPAEPTAGTPAAGADAKAGNSVDDAVDLVEEAVAQFEEEAGLGPATDGGALVGFPPLARVLVEGKRVPIDAMRSALFEQERSGQSLARTLTGMGLVTEADLMWGMAREMGLEFVDLDLAGVDLAAAYRLPESTARYHQVLVIGERDGVPVVASANPTNVLARDDLQTLLGRQFHMVVATRSQIGAYLDRAYNQGGSAAEVASSAAGELGGDGGAEELESLQAAVDDAPIVRYVNLLVLQALNERASDIHVEPTADNLRIRYRIDGVLHDMSTAPRSIAGAVTTRLKVMADLNIAEHRVPQDGRISLKVGTRTVDLRVATLPTIYGEKVVMRVLDKSNVVLGFEELGFDADLLERYAGVYTKPYGTILVTGPTGSGKTTTLYATLSVLNSPEKNIITVEDPVELRIKGINQVQLNAKAGLTFAAALRSILRSDPDIVLVGEIRDRETAVISVEAALTGHLVLATLHTNDAASTPMRLVEMGIERYLVSSAASAVLAQRLARRLCPHCKEPFEPTEAELAAAGWEPGELEVAGSFPKLYRAVGCSACSHTGYRGRKALAELLIVTEEVEHMIIEGGSADDIHRLAVSQGMVTLRQSGVRRALEGETTLEEVLRVVA
jgi:type IV pilus assembly protein PilB